MNEKEKVSKILEDYGITFNDNRINFIESIKNLALELFEMKELLKSENYKWFDYLGAIKIEVKENDTEFMEQLTKKLSKVAKISSFSDYHGNYIIYPLRSFESVMQIITNSNCNYSHYDIFLKKNTILKNNMED